MRGEEVTKFEKFKQRKPQEKPRNEKKRKINFNEEHRKAKRNRTRDKTLNYNG